MKAANKIRISADVSEAVHAKAQELCKALGRGESVSLREAMVRAIIFTNAIAGHAAAGGRFILRNADGAEREVILL